MKENNSTKAIKFFIQPRKSNQFNKEKIYKNYNKIIIIIATATEKQQQQSQQIQKQTTFNIQHCFFFVFCFCRSLLFRLFVGFQY